MIAPEADRSDLDEVQESFGGLGLCCRNFVGDSFCESSIVSEVDEPTQYTDVESPELARVLSGAQTPGIDVDLVSS